MPGGFRITLQNDERLMRKLAEMGAIVRREAAERTQVSVDLVKNRAVAGIANGPKSGRVYTTYFATSHYGGVYPWGSRPPHRASARGEYPAADTGNLMRSIFAEVDQGLAGLAGDDLSTQLSFSLDDVMADAAAVHGIIGADASYAIPLEYKPPERGGRPFLRKALYESRDEIHSIFLGMRGKFNP